MKVHIAKAIPDLTERPIITELGNMEWRRVPALCVRSKMKHKQIEGAIQPPLPLLIPPYV